MKRNRTQAHGSLLEHSSATRGSSGTKRAGDRMRRLADFRLHETHLDRSDALVAGAHGRFDYVGRARPAKFPHNPSGRIRLLRRALAGTTALVAVVLAGTLVGVATATDALAASAAAGRGGDGGVSSEGNGGGYGGANQTTNQGSPGGNAASNTGGGGGGGGGGGAGFPSSFNNGIGFGGGPGGTGAYDGGGTGGFAGGAGGFSFGPSSYGGGFGQPGQHGGSGGGGGGGGGGEHGFVGSTLPNNGVTGGNGGYGGDGSRAAFDHHGGGAGGGAGGYGAVVTGSGLSGEIGGQIKGGNGGNGGNQGTDAEQGSGGSGGVGLWLSGIGQVTISASSTVYGGTGGNAGHSGGFTDGFGGFGGYGGDGVSVSGSGGHLINHGKIKGGAGGYGGTGFRAGGAAGGGNGVSLGTGLTFTNYGTITGGTGGDGGLTGLASYQGPNMNGANGGHGVSLGNNVNVTNNGNINGGMGGTTRSLLTGDGGAGGTGVGFVGGFFTNNGTITGGTGGDGSAAGTGGNGGWGMYIAGNGAVNNHTIMGGQGQRGGINGGTGGDGVHITGGALFINHGTITGGTGGQGLSASGGDGGTGVSVNGGTLVNSGTINFGGGGKGFDGNYGTNGDAITFGSGTNKLELWSGSTINGYVKATTGANDTLALGGTVNGSFYVSQIGQQYQGFEAFEKTGSSTWTLTGTTDDVTPWTIQQGTLSISHDGGLGATSGGLSFNGGTLENTSAFTTARTVTLSSGGGTFNTAADLTAAGVISGPGALTKTGAGTLTLTGTNTYSGGTIIEAGTLSVSSDGNLGLATGGLTFIVGGTLQNTAAFTTARNVTLIGGGTFQTDADLMVNGVISDGIPFVGGALTKTGNGTLTLTGNNTYSGGTTISAGMLQIGNAGTTGSIVGDVTNNGTLAFNRSDDLSYGGTISGTGALTKLSAGTLTLTRNNTFSGGTTISAGTLQIGNGGTSGSIIGDVVNNGVLAFNRSDDLSYGGTISGAGALTKLGAGTLTLTGTNTYNGATTIQAGTLMVDGTVGGAMNVAAGGALGGFGTVGGVATVASGGTLIGRQGEVLNFGSDLTLSSGSNVNVSLGRPETTGLFNVTGNLALGGQLNVIDLGGFSAGVYRLFDYGGNLTGSLAIGTVPFGVDPSDVTVQTAVANQVNLINTTGVILRFWDGGNPANRDNNVVNGGNGVWNLSDANWTEANGASNGAWSNGHFAIFEGQAGTVTVAGAISVTGMQFATDGYRVEGDAITLERPETIIRTGFGSQSGAGVTATIASELTGIGGLTKTDFGTLVLTGANSYTGGTIVREGTLQLGDGGTTGSIIGDVTNHGTLAFNRSDTFTFAGAISGMGTVVQAGSGTTVLTGANTYSGGTLIGAGTLSVAADGNLGAASGGLNFDGGTLQTTAAFTTARDIALNSGGGTLQTDADLTASGVIFGTGALTKTGNGRLTLTGNNIYSGGTTISAGTLGIGDGGTSGSIVGDVTNNSVLAFDRADDLIYGGIVSGTGTIAKFGAGTLTLTAANTYNGGTIINAGTLSVASDANLGAASGGITFNGGTLENTSVFITARAISLAAAGGTFNTAADLTATGLISGTGALAKLGAGRLTLTGTNIFTGGTTIAAGALQIGNGGTSGSIVGNVVNNGVLAFNRSNDLSFAGVISGTGALAKLGAGTLTLTGTNTYTGSTTINAGTLSVASDANLGAASAGLIFNGGTLENTSAFSTARAISLAAGGGTFNTAADLAAAGVISGPGALTKTGAGRLTLTGTNTYSGGTTIAAGTLQIGNGGTSGSIVGDVVNNGVLAFDRSDDLTYGGIVSGTGALAKLGAGRLTLTGTNTYTGSTTVESGALIVNGSIAASSLLTVNAGGLVGGTGTLPSTSINGGALSPGNSIGTIEVQGNLALSTAASYLVDVSATAADRSNVSGTAALGGTVRVKAAPDDYGLHTSYIILHADGGVSGTETLSATVNSVFLDPTLSDDGNNVFLNLTLLPFSSAARTPNQRAVADALQAGGTRSALGAVVLNQATAAGARQAFDALSGEVHASVLGVLADDSRYVRSAVLGRLRQAPYAEGPLAALGIGGPALAYEQPQQPVYAADFPIKAAPAPVVPARSPSLTFWAHGYGAWGTFDGNGNAATIDRSLGGALIGLDSGLADGWRVGFAAGYSQSNLRIGARASSARIDSGHVALYGGGSFGAWNLRAGAAYAHHQIDTSRAIVFPGFFDRATTDHGGGTAQVFGEIGYGIGLGPVAIEPFAGLAFVQVKTNGFSETGGVAALAGASATEEVGYSSLGARFATTFALVEGMTLTPRASFAWQHAFGDMTPAVALAFQSTGAGFGITGVPLARDSALIEAGLDLRITPQVTLGASYLGQFASSVQDHAVKGHFTWKF